MCPQLILCEEEGAVSFTIPVSGVNGSGLWTTNTEKRNNSICLPPPPPLARNEMVYQCGTGGSARLFTFAGSEINSIERRLNGRRINQRFNPEKRDVWRRGDLCLPARRTYAKIAPHAFISTHTVTLHILADAKIRLEH